MLGNGRGAEFWRDMKSSITILFNGANGLEQGARGPGIDEERNHCSKESRSLTPGIWNHKGNSDGEAGSEPNQALPAQAVPNWAG